MGDRRTHGIGFGRPTGFLLALLGLVAALAVAGPAAAGPDGADTSTAPWIASDKPDYAPGERVTLDGGNWQPGESVRIEVEDDQGKTWQRDVTVGADAAGRISDSFDLPDWFVATYSVRATGSSGAVARASFTDGNVTVRARAGTTALAVTFPAGSAESFTNTTCAGTAAASNASPFTTPTNTSYTNSGVAANNSQSASLEAPSPVTIGGTTYVFASWSADNPAELTVSTTGTTGCFSRGPSQSNNPAWNITANYVAAPTTVGTTTTAASASATYGDSTVTLTATVTPAGGPAVGAGTVTFTVKQASATVGTASSGPVSGGSASASFPLAGVDAGTYTIEASYGGTGGFDPSSNASQSPAPTLTVGQKTVTGSFTAANKVYDGSDSATITGRSLSGGVVGDDVDLSGGTATFADESVGGGKTVTGTGFALSGTKAGNYALAASTLTTTADITALGITGSFTAADKEYDGTTGAQITGRSLDGAIAGDDVSLSGGTASFADKHAGEDKPVSGSGFALAGDDRDNYTLTSVGDTTASITPKALTGSFTAADKEYDGTRSASVTGTSLPGVLGDDDVSLEVANALFDTKHVGSDKDVAGDLSLSGDDAGNYGVNASHTTSADITAKAITGSFTAADKVYDGTADAQITGRSLDGAIAGDDVGLSGGTASFADKHAGADKPVSGSAFALAGDDRDNYTLTSVGDTTASITARGLDVSAHGVDKVYDGTTAASVTFGDDRVAGDAFTIAYTAAFADKHVGADKPVSVSAIALSGADAGNYELGSTTASASADITERALTVGAAGVNKVYDGTTDATVVLSDDRVSGDDLSLSYAGAAFADANAGAGKPVSVTGIAVAGPDAANYTHNTTASATATIAPRPITVTADAKSKAFGAPDPALTYGVSGGPLVAGDGFSGSLTRVAGEGVGSYDILLGSVSAGPNYAIAYVGAKLTIGAWHATGFYQPIGMPNSQFVAAPGSAPHVSTAVWNTAKGGSTIPLKFNLFTTQGGQERTSTADVKEFQAVKLGVCTGGDGEEAIEFVTTGSTSLRYDATERQFVQNWKTPAVSKEECYRVNVRFQDNSAVYAFVKLRK